MSAKAFKSDDFNFRPTTMSAAFSDAGADKASLHMAREPKRATMRLIRRDGALIPHLRAL